MKNEAEMRRVPRLEGPPGLDVAKLLGWLVMFRASAVPLMVIILSLVAVIDPRPWRLAVLGIVGVLGIGLSLAERKRHERQPLEPDRVPANALVSALVLVLILLTTGGMSSPLIPGVVIITFAASVLSGQSPFRWFLVALMSAAVMGIAVLQTRAGLEALSPGWMLPETFSRRAAWQPFVVAGVLSVLMCVASLIGVRLHRALERMVRQAIEAREEVLRSYYEQARDLTALSGEIAHELKNPLTSIKGLAGLMALELKEGKSAERLATLRREVDRMQGILEEFLNFSRPLVALSQTDVSLELLCHDVLALHEGVLQSRGVSSSLEGAAEVRGDPRKLKQILINLVQNAVEASPSGRSIVLRVRAEGAMGILEVDDEGPGLASEVADRVFLAGVTTKSRGSGLGLTIARALARQHGGELEILNREQGGCRAVLSIPMGGTA